LKIRPQGQEQQIYPFQPFGKNSIAYTGAVYRIQLDSNIPVTRIDQPKAKEVSGFSVAANGNKISFSVATYDKEISTSTNFNQAKSSGYITLLVGGKRHRLAESGQVALHNNVLVVGNNISEKEGQISIFNLSHNNILPQKIKIPILVEAIILTEKFIIVSDQKYVSSTRYSQPKTLILNTSTFSSSFLAGAGDISADGNLLVRSHSGSADSEIPGVIEFFDISTTPPKLIQKKEGGSYRSFLTKDFLFTSVLRYTPGDINSNSISKVKTCINSHSE
jgi:hypothetical protein